ncbi:MAG TPA: RNA polymerase sigma factor [Polyangiaceae bacterium]
MTPDDKAPASDRALYDRADRAMGRYADGDEAAFAEVFAVVGPRIQRFLRRLCGADELARDLFQDTLLRMHQARGAFRPGAAVLPWAYAIARNAFVDSARARKRRPVTIGGTGADEPAEPAVAPDAESSVLANETARAVARALAGMTDARREAFVLVRFEGMSIADAAQILGASENAVKLRAFQAYEIIRGELGRLEKPGALS